MSNLSNHCPTCTCGVVTEYRYRPTGQKVAVLRIANLGQARPDEPGSGERLYAIRFPDGTLGQATPGELRELGPDGWRSFTVTAALRLEADRLTGVARAG